MTTTSRKEDVETIEAIVDRQFRSLEWSDGEDGDWETFIADFLPGASLFPSARPVNKQSVDAFVERMRALSKTSLHTFKERMLGTDIRVFGNVAVALAACEITENGTTESRGVEALLLAKDDGVWKIVAQTWHMEDEENTIPDDLLSRR